MRQENCPKTVPVTGHCWAVYIMKPSNISELYLKMASCWADSKLIIIINVSMHIFHIFAHSQVNQRKTAEAEYTVLIWKLPAGKD